MIDLNVVSQRQTDSVDTPPSGYQVLFQKTDGDWYVKDDAGTESFVFSPVRASIRSTGETSVSTTADVDKINAALGTTLTAGKYRVTISYYFNSNVNNRSLNAKCTIGGTALSSYDSTFHSEEVRDSNANQGFLYKRSYLMDFATDTNPTVRLFFNITATAATFKVSEAMFEFEKVGGPPPS